jgi:hypothetical protein
MDECMQKNPGGRPSKATPERLQAILLTISKRVPYIIAAEANGICEATLYDWLDTGRQHIAEGIDSDLAKFSESLKKIESELIAKHLKNIDDCVDRWQAQAWLLERRWWRHFTPHGSLKDLSEEIDKVRHELKGVKPNGEVNISEAKENIE